ncbi:MAG: UDP-3-O-(3-hydroxymyristoyl)glucosamine N-acyltransferase [Bacteroidota bacterium]|nr:UDP-3-O-(3-hydroxymyristoyl)glucosamine N-acyltransferase [Bacteroidota bacterium]
MKYTAKIIADFINGEIIGNPEAIVTEVAKIEEGTPESISFLANPKYNEYLYTTNSSVVIINKDFKIEKEIKTTLIKVDDAYKSFAKLLELHEKNKKTKSGLSKKAYKAKSAKIGKGVYIGEFVSIGENVVIKDKVKLFPHVYIGDNTIIEENTTINSGVKIYNDCSIGKNCIFHSGVIIGSDGFGFAPQADNNYKKVPQVGNVIIEDNVEIGANTAIDRATMGSTIIRKGVKLDNLIQIGHNVEIGENTVIAAQTGVAGSTKIGRDCMIGGQVGFVGHIKIGDRVKIAAQSGISSSIKDDIVVQGSPAFDYGKYQKSYVLFRKLPDIYKEIRELKNEIKDLKK